MLIRFTGLLGKEVLINSDEVVSIREAEAGIDSPKAKTVIVLSSGSFDVVETFAEVEKKLNVL